MYICNSESEKGDVVCAKLILVEQTKGLLISTFM
jgi:hypothetical protein